MLIPRRVKHRKQHHPKRSGAAKGGTRVTFGTYGIQALEPAYVTNRQIEAARIAITRHVKRGGQVWINIYPDRPLTKKPAETRMPGWEPGAGPRLTMTKPWTNWAKHRLINRNSLSSSKNRLGGWSAKR